MHHYGDVVAGCSFMNGITIPCSCIISLEVLFYSRFNWILLMEVEVCTQDNHTLLHILQLSLHYEKLKVLDFVG